MKRRWGQVVYWATKKRCTPFIGAGASADALPLASTLAGLTFGFYHAASPEFRLIT